MIFEYIKPLDNYEDIKIENLSQQRLPNHKYGFLEIKNNTLQIFVENELYNIKILKNDYDIKELINKNTKIVIYIKESIRDKFATINIYNFYFNKEFLKLNILIDDKVFDNAKKKNLINNHNSIKELGEKFIKLGKIDINYNQYFILGLAYNENINNFDNESFLLFIDGYTLAIKNTKIDNDNNELIITKIIEKKPQNENNLILLKTEISFGSDLISDNVSSELQTIIQDENSYINVWNKFLDFEGQLLLDKAKQIGAYELVDIVPQEVGLELVLKKHPQNLTIGDTIGLFQNKPYYLEDNFTFKELEAQLEKDSIKNELFFEIQQIRENSVFIENNNIKILKQMKFIAYSIYGDKVQIERKLKSRELILKGKAANPFLGLILEENANLTHKSNITKIEPLSEFVEKKIFENPPTLNQKEAISIALNTPDIAIIQGPPGTGKTTVITAIIERLNELKEKEKIKGRILVVGYQHDAVTNLTQRLSINSLPAIKFGKKDIEGEYKKYQIMLKWAEEIKRSAKKNIKNYSNQKKLNKLDNLVSIYLQSPSNQTALNILDNLKIILPQKIDIFEEYKSKFKDDVFNINELKEIYALRVEKKSFEDDGKDRIKDLLNTKFIKILSDDEKNKLNIKDIKYIDDYRKIKIKLLEYFYPKPKYKKPKLNNEFVELLEKLKDDLEAGTTKTDKINKILFEYVNELENNPFALFEMIKDYSFVFASSVQQSARKDINIEKGNDFYDVVIVDEAARVPPMDLFIPMVKGKKIILVGDHRQLPHLVDDKILEDIVREGNIEDELIKTSIFEYLIKRTKKLQEVDGINRVITLNNQYRTNPILGEFISKNFYEKYSESERFSSPRPSEDFTHKLDGIENLPCAWINVPNQICSEAKDESKSTYRDCEAKEIVKYLKKWMLLGADENLSYGVISFYKAQVNLIKKLIAQELPHYIDKIRIGSVDAFQGMEFDVVFLSATRSKKIEEMKYSSAGGLFGFLVSKNRLNVAMSRQKKVLIGVGDKEYFISDKAKKYVPEIGEFIALCEEKGKIL